MPQSDNKPHTKQPKKYTYIDWQDEWFNGETWTFTEEEISMYMTHGSFGSAYRSQAIKRGIPGTAVSWAFHRRDHVMTIGCVLEEDQLQSNPNEIH